MDLETLLKSVTAKLGVLELSRKQIEKSLKETSRNNQREIEKRLQSSEQKIDEVNELILKIQEEKLVSGENVDDVELWGNEITDKIKIHQQTANDMRTTLETIKREAIEENHKSQLVEEETKLSRAIEEERKLQYAKIKIREELEAKISVTDCERNNKQTHPIRVKLPDLIIAKFNGSHTDFLRFWNTFTE